MCTDRRLFAGLAAGWLALALPARAEPLQPSLAGLAFLLGDWKSGAGEVAETGGAARGASRFTAEAGGSVLLRRDHTELSGPDGRKTGGFDQIMMIYQEGGALHADYADPAHIIHYTSAIVAPGRSVVFASAQAAGAPTFRLSYDLAAPDTLAVSSSMAPPASTAFHPLATGQLNRDGRAGP